MNLTTINNDCLSNIVKFIDEPLDLLNFRATCKKVKEVIDKSLLNEDFATEAVTNNAMMHYTKATNRNIECSLVKLLYTSNVDEYSKNYMGICWENVNNINDNFKENNKNRSVKLCQCNIADDLSFFKNSKKIKITRNTGVVSGLGCLKLEYLMIDKSMINLEEQYKNIKNIKLVDVNIEDVKPFDKCNVEQLEIIKCNNLTNITNIEFKGNMRINWCNNLQTISDSNFGWLSVTYCMSFNEMTNINVKNYFSVYDCPEMTTIIKLTSNYVKISTCDTLTGLYNLTCESLTLMNCEELSFTNNVIAKSITAHECFRLSRFDNSYFEDVNMTEVPLTDASVFRNAKSLTFFRCSSLTDVSNLHDMDELEIYRCPSLVNVSNLSNIRRIFIEDCENMNTFENVTNYGTLVMTDCGQFEDIVNIPYRPM